jgi:hypothetical protein
MFFFSGQVARAFLDDSAVAHSTPLTNVCDARYGTDVDDSTYWAADVHIRVSGVDSAGDHDKRGARSVERAVFAWFTIGPRRGDRPRPQRRKRFAYR